jgi:hypothetical protein
VLPTQLSHSISSRPDPTRLDIGKTASNRFNRLAFFILARILNLPELKRLRWRERGAAVGELFVDECSESENVVSTTDGHSDTPFLVIKDSQAKAGSQTASGATPPPRERAGQNDQHAERGEEPEE